MSETNGASNGNGKHPKPSGNGQNGRLVRAREESLICRLLDEKDAISLSIDALIDSLYAMRSYGTPDGPITEPDYATRVKAAQALLSYAVGEPIKRSQVLHGEIPKTPIEPSELKKLIDAKLSTRINSDNVTTAELVAAKKALSESEEAMPSKLTPVERENEIKRILGVE